MILKSINGSTFAASVILLQLGNFSLLESTSHHKRRILNVKFPANIVVPLLLRWRPPLYRWDLRMLSWKITFFSSLFSISIYFFRALFAVLLSVRTGDTNILTVRIMSYDQIFDLFEFFIKDIFILYDSSFVPIWIMMLLGFFLDLELSETLDLLFLRQEKSHFYLLSTWKFYFPQTCYHWISCY